ncbi:MAG TPA: ABC transporter permease [Ktedonobacterales bacterium]|nr:ABC transporter permease [Ktedonobacterales bacterium]
MIDDIKTMMWKEWREYLSAGGNSRRGNLGVIIFVLIVGIVLPASNKGTAFLDSPLPIVLYGCYLPIFVIINVVADAFAGERERHTLETLLASRLSDRAILIGKIAAAVSYGWGLGLVAAVLGAITTNLAHGTGSVRFYPANMVAGIVFFGLATATLASTAGCLLSLRAGSVRQVQQMLGVGVMCVVLVPVIGINLLSKSLRAQLLDKLNQMGANQIFLLILIVLAVVDVILIAVAFARFRRSRLILS